MKGIEKIVVPVDLDKNTEKLIDFAVFMANKLDSGLSLVHAVEFVVMGEMALGNISYNDYNSAMVDQAKEKLEEITRKVAGTCKSCTSEVLVGDIVDEIVGYAEKQDADMIVIGTHGKRGLEKILLGSVAERVLKSAHCPVLVMNPYR